METYTTAQKDTLLVTDREIKKKILADRVYGIIPENPYHLDIKTEFFDGNFAAGRATFKRLSLLISIDSKQVELPFTAVIPNCSAPCPAIISIDYEDEVPNKYLPAEEIIQRGYAIFAFSIDCEAKSRGGFKSSISAHIAKSRRRKNAPGKLAVLAWAAMRIADYAEKFENIDNENIVIAGHALHGKAALLAGAFDERFRYIIANDSIAFGCGKRAEQMAVSAEFLFCPAFLESDDDRKSIDEHGLLLDLCSPRYILVGSADDDPRSDPEAELAALTSLGRDRADISYHLRHGTQYLSRDDWNIYLDFIGAKIGKNRFFYNNILHFS